MMASVFPLELDELMPMVDQARASGVIEIANYNSPTQHVVAGEGAAIEAVMRLVDEEFCIEPTVIEKKIPMHTPLFRPVADLLRPHLERAGWQAAKAPYLPNVTAELIDGPSGDEIAGLLARHVYSPVHWRESIDLLAKRHLDAVFVEVGPRAVLFNLLQKRWHRNRKFKTDVTGDIADNLTQIRQQTAT
jgi:[acyl-carrier-protein] S-malonyltransferase